MYWVHSVISLNATKVAQLPVCKLSCPIMECSLSLFLSPRIADARGQQWMWPEMSHGFIPVGFCRCRRQSVQSVQDCGVLLGSK